MSATTRNAATPIAPNLRHRDAVALMQSLRAELYGHSPTHEEKLA